MRGASRAPKRSESRSITGRAPIVKTSRRMPPTPVAAPWYGSMNDGWLWDSILKTHTQPRPRSTTPAFSPGPWTTRGPPVGNLPKYAREDLYEQCSDQRAAKIPSSVRLGLRPRSVRMRWYSCSDKPCSRASSAVAGAFQVMPPPRARE